MRVLRLKKGADRRVRQGYPWVFASELAHSAREFGAGEIVELHDGAGHFLARGFVHPRSQIAFRKLTANARETNPSGVDFYVRRLSAARALRERSGWTNFSHRWFYAEADGVPGLIIDLFKTVPQGWVAVVQASTAGAELALPDVFAAVQTFKLESLTIIEAPSSKARALEGLTLRDKQVVFGGRDDLEDLTIELGAGLKMRSDFKGGQKTGFFLDQQANALALRRLLPKTWEGAFKVLDICCYVGQWGSHTASELKQNSIAAEVTAFDSSRAALDLAVKNLGAAGANAHAVEGDALNQLGELPKESFDLVICDPPAFVKKKADLEAGLRAYTKINREALRLVRPGGLLVASSCSGLVKSAEFKTALGESSAKAGRVFRELLTGGHAPDHPVRADFPEGEYLKCLIGQVDLPF